MAAKVRNVVTGGVVGVSESVAEALCLSSEFERVIDAPAPAKKAASKRPAKK